MSTDDLRYMIADVLRNDLGYEPGALGFGDIADEIIAAIAVAGMVVGTPAELTDGEHGKLWGAIRGCFSRLEDGKEADMALADVAAIDSVNRLIAALPGLRLALVRADDALSGDRNDGNDDRGH